MVIFVVVFVRQESHPVADLKDGLKLMRIYLSKSPKCWNNRHQPLHQLHPRFTMTPFYLVPHFIICSWKLQVGVRIPTQMLALNLGGAS